MEKLMSDQLRYVQSYQAMVEANLQALPEDEAMALSVGGHYDRFGVLEFLLLRQLGLSDTATVVDVGCGAGRLAVRLAALPGVRYCGTDVVPQLINYARRRCARPDFGFALVDRIEIPAKAASADFITFFSVFTHLLHEEAFVYLEEAKRVLKPGGTVVFSFLDYGVSHNWGVFQSNIEWVRSRSYMGHINIFMHPADLNLWADKLGFTVAATIRGDEQAIAVNAAHALPDLPVGRHGMGQSVCVWRKPG
jgi:SAM-dependent methyltransferase